MWFPVPIPTQHWPWCCGLPYIILPPRQKSVKVAFTNLSIDHQLQHRNSIKWMHAVFFSSCLVNSLYAREFRWCSMSHCLESSPLENAFKTVCVTGSQKHQLHVQLFRSTFWRGWGHEESILLSALAKNSF